MYVCTFFRIPSDEKTNLDLVSRFIALAAIKPSSQSAFFKGLSLTPVYRMRLTDLLQKTTDETVCPYTRADKYIQSQPVSILFFYVYEL